MYFILFFIHYKIIGYAIYYDEYGNSSIIYINTAAIIFKIITYQNLRSYFKIQKRVSPFLFRFIYKVYVLFKVGKSIWKITPIE